MLFGCGRHCGAEERNSDSLIREKASAATFYLPRICLAHIVIWWWAAKKWRHCTRCIRSWSQHEQRCNDCHVVRVELHCLALPLTTPGRHCYHHRDHLLRCYVECLPWGPLQLKPPAIGWECSVVPGARSIRCYSGCQEGVGHERETVPGLEEVLPPLADLISFPHLGGYSNGEPSPC